MTIVIEPFFDSELVRDAAIVLSAAKDEAFDEVFVIGRDADGALHLLGTHGADRSTLMAAEAIQMLVRGDFAA
ncbi:MAG: hypothetical protein RJA36_3585 [Pseudomonadota bacterium]|jgi:hypothetical protein